MKKNIPLMFVLFILIAAFSFSVVSEEIDLTDPEQINALSPSELAEVIYKIPDRSIISDKNLVAALDENPEIAIELSYENLVRAVNYEADLVQNPAVFQKLDRTVQAQPSLINKNPGVKAVWFALFGISDEGALVGSYDGSRMVLKSKEGETGSTITNLKSPLLQNAIVTEQGELILANNAVFMRGSEAEFMDGGSINMKTGNLDLTKFAGGELDLSLSGDASVFTEDYAIFSPSSEEITVKFTDGVIDAEGEDVIVLKSVEHEGPEEGYTYTKSFEFSGRVQITDSETILHKDTKYTYFSPLYDEGSFTASVEKETHLLDYEDECPDDASCIRMFHEYYEMDSGGTDILELFVDPADDNQIYIESHSRSVDRITVSEINDESTVTFDEEFSSTPPFSGSRLVFSKDPTFVVGKIGELYAEYIKHYPGDVYEYHLKGEVAYCVDQSCSALGVMEIKQPEKSDLRVVHTYVNAADGQAASERGANQREDMKFKGYTSREDIPSEPSEIRIYTGHHDRGGFEIYSDQYHDGEPVHFNDFPEDTETEALMFSTCHSVPDPEDVEGRGSEMLYTMIEKYPNLNIVMGYTNVAPVDDTELWENNLLPGYPRDASSSEDYSDYANNMIDQSGEFLEETGRQHWSEQPDRYRMSFYVKEGDQWMYYDAEHPDGVVFEPKPPSFSVASR
ncbi:hypothetical protein GF345_03980 [Candidatus Woesearchaeota archaeon]|nr:hypothetical protein [Candidatus Woesearchaeota archaeon]